MNKHITDEKTGISYTLQGDYYLLDLAYHPKKNSQSAFWGSGIYGISRNTSGLLYTNLLTSGKLNSYLADVDR